MLQQVGRALLATKNLTCFTKHQHNASSKTLKGNSNMQVLNNLAAVNWMRWSFLTISRTLCLHLWRFQYVNQHNHLATKFKHTSNFNSAKHSKTVKLISFEKSQASVIILQIRSLSSKLQKPSMVQVSMVVTTTSITWSTLLQATH